MCEFDLEKKTYFKEARYWHILKCVHYSIPPPPQRIIVIHMLVVISRKEVTTLMIQFVPQVRCQASTFKGGKVT